MLTHTLDQIKVCTEYTGMYDNVSQKIQDSLRNAALNLGKKPQNRSDGTDPELSLSSDTSKNHTQLSEDSVYRRDVQVAMTSLWDPNTDNPGTGTGFQKERHKILANNPSRRLSPIKDHGPKPRKPSLLQRNRKPQAPDSPPLNEPAENSIVEPEMLLQPDTRPISHEQLVVEVKGIYAGLVMVEAKCIDIDEKQSAVKQPIANAFNKVKVRNDQWQSLIVLYKQLLHEHHDFFLVSQHPSASPALRKLAAKYSMPARMWRHGIHAFLEVLRHRLPDSLEHMLAFIYLAYSMMALLHETVNTFEDTWIECLGDLGRYRMAIEDDEPKDREVWSNVARFWYNKAADKSPNIKRL